METKLSRGGVLIVDDEPLVRWSVAEILSGLGFRVVGCADGAGARLAVRGADPPFDVVVLDLRLPDGADLSLLRALSSRARVVLLTAFGTPELEREARAAGAVGVIDKPFEMNELAQAVIAAAELPRSTARELFRTGAK